MSERYIEKKQRMYIFYNKRILWIKQVRVYKPDIID